MECLARQPSTQLGLTVRLSCMTGLEASWRDSKVRALEGGLRFRFSVWGLLKEKPCIFSVTTQGSSLMPRKIPPGLSAPIRGKSER